MKFSYNSVDLLKNKLSLALCIILFVSIESIQSLKYEFVTWTSVIKLVNVNTNTRLHSHDVKYGSGSGQQSVTAVKNADDHNSFWQILSPIGFDQVNRGEKVKCGSNIRLLHLSTRRNLHSHLFLSPLSNNQEVSAFGEDGKGDEGDTWTVDCDADDYWRRDESVRLQHKATQKYLHVSGDVYGRPIQGQYEVSCFQYRNAYNLWKVQEGVYVKPVQPSSENYHSEL